MDANKKLEKKIKLLETAYQLFRSAGVSATAIDDVVKSAGIARGTFYLYFKDKSDLIDQLVLYKSTETMKELLKYTRTRMADDESDFYATIRRTLELYVDFLETHRDIIVVLQKNISACLRNFPVFFDEEARTLYEEILRRFESEGFPAEIAQRTIFFAISMIDAVCSDTILYSRPFPSAEIREPLIDSAMAIFTKNRPEREGVA